MIEELLKLTADKEGTIAKDALLSIVNLSADEAGATILLEKVMKSWRFSILPKCSQNLSTQAPNIIIECTRFILDENCPLADAWAMVLSNISRPESLAERVVDEIEANGNNLLEKLVSAFTRTEFNKKTCNLNYLGENWAN